MRYLLAVVISLLLFSCSATEKVMQKVEPELKLHVPSPEWQDQVMYFIMIDRFNDGDSSNNDQGMGEYDPADERKFSGGDLKGITQKLDYIKELGATSIWITPPVANQWWNPGVQFGGYHGYWAQDFKSIDKHFGSLDDYKQLSDQMHRRNMYLIHDIVVNHTGDYFYYKGDYNPDEPQKNYHFNKGVVPTTAPTQFPFSLNNVNNPEHLVADIYNWTPNILNYQDKNERLYYQLSGLDDLNTENPVVRNALKDSYRYWIKEVGVDAYRIDTIIYVETDFWNDFVHASDGMNVAASETGRDEFLMFGEAFVGSEPYSEEGDKFVASYFGTAEQPGVNSMLNFPLHYTLRRVFAEGNPTAYLGYRLNLAANSGIYKKPHTLTNFLDNHDTQRFMETGSLEAFKQALTCLLTIPGIPIIYQGTEQAFDIQRKSMFAEGWASEGKDHFDTDSQMFVFLQDLIQLRKDHLILSRGDLSVLQESKVGSGVLAYRRTYNGKSAIVLFNTADERILLSNLKTGLAKNTVLQKAFGRNLPSQLICKRDGTLSYELPARSYGVYFVDDVQPGLQQTSQKLTIEAAPTDTLRSDLQLQGSIDGDIADVRIVIDGKLDRSLVASVQGNHWTASLPISRFPFGDTRHTLTAYSKETGASSRTIEITTSLRVQGKVLKVDDPKGDDHGPNGNYKIPSDVTFGKQMDIEHVELRSFGGNLMVQLRMGEVSTYWAPPNKFDHVGLQVFIDLPNSEGKSVLPRLNASAPEGFLWDFMSYSSGWVNILFSAKEATGQINGTLVTPAPDVQVDEAERTITLLYSPDALGNPETLSGGKVYITTWDGAGSEGFHRALTPEGAAFEFGGGDGRTDPLILDDTMILEIP
ncbi:MAG: alpha-amylase family glycosyl hydrolase [Calditrichia bacterium]